MRSPQGLADETIRAIGLFFFFGPWRSQSWTLAQPEKPAKFILVDQPT
jgi:hypothetical protein